MKLAHVVILVMVATSNGQSTYHEDQTVGYSAAHLDDVQNVRYLELLVQQLVDSRIVEVQRNEERQRNQLISFLAHQVDQLVDGVNNREQLEYKDDFNIGQYEVLHEAFSRLRQSLVDINLKIANTTQQTGNRMSSFNYSDVQQFSSCKDMKTRQPSALSGEYVIVTGVRRLPIKVYCEMGLNGGGYTFIHPSETYRLTNPELQTLFTDRTNFLMRVRKTDNTQPYGVLRQIPAFADINLKIGLSEHDQYQAPFMMAHLPEPYLFFGFISEARARSRTTQGIQVNSVSTTFVNGDANPNSYMALFPNYAERVPPVPLDIDYNWDFYNRVIAGLRLPPSGRVIPEEYFMYLDTHFGGGGCRVQTDGQGNTRGVLGAAIGFR